MLASATLTLGVAACGDDDSHRERQARSEAARDTSYLSPASRATVLHHDGLRRPRRGQGARRDAGLPGCPAVRLDMQMPILNAVAAEARPAGARAHRHEAMYAPISRSPTPSTRSCPSTPSSTSPTSPCRRTRPTTTPAAARRPRPWRADRRRRHRLRRTASTRASRPPARAEGLQDEPKKPEPRCADRVRHRPPNKAASVVKAPRARNPDLKGIYDHRQPVKGTPVSSSVPTTKSS